MTWTAEAKLKAIVETAGLAEPELARLHQLAPDFANFTAVFARQSLKQLGGDFHFACREDLAPCAGGMSQEYCVHVFARNHPQ